MSTAAPETVVPVTALVFPLLVGLALLIDGVAALRSPTRESGLPLLPWLRIGTGAALLLTGGAIFAVAAVGAVALCIASLAVALGDYGRASVTPAGAARLAGAAGLLAFAAVTAVEGLLGFGGVATHLSRFDLRDLSWAAALVGVLAVSSLLQLGGVGAGRPARSEPVDSRAERSP